MQTELTAAVHRLEDIFKGENIPFTSYDPVKKVFILLVSGDQAEQYRKVVEAVRDLVTDASTKATDSLVAALNQQPK